MILLLLSNCIYLIRLWYLC